MHIEHINIRAAQPLLDELRDFYCALFALRVGFRPKSPIRGYWLYGEGDRPWIHLAVSDEPVVPGSNGCLDHIAFQMTGLREIIERLKSLGVEYTTDGFEEIGMTQLFFSDPAGVGLEINFLDESLESLGEA